MNDSSSPYVESHEISIGDEPPTATRKALQLVNQGFSAPPRPSRIKNRSLDSSIDKKSIRIIDNSLYIKEHKEIGFALKLKTPALVPAAGESFSLHKILKKPTVDDMKLFDKDEDQFTKKLDALVQVSLQNGVDFPSFKDRVDKLIASHDVATNPDFMFHVRERQNEYKKLYKK